MFSNVLIPGSIREVSKQFLRCVLIKLAPNGIFSELFRSSLKGKITTTAEHYAVSVFWRLLEEVERQTVMVSLAV